MKARRLKKIKGRIKEKIRRRKIRKRKITKNKRVLRLSVETQRWARKERKNRKWKKINEWKNENG